MVRKDSGSEKNFTHITHLTKGFYQKPILVVREDERRGSNSEQYNWQEIVAMDDI